jgi:SAM-dependent methyltransferase
MKALEIGCGKKRSYRADFIGLDRFPLPGVDVIVDLDEESIPFPDNFFDLIYASHSLEHVHNLIGVMKEIWRISKPDAQLCILAPYCATSLNVANPYHLHNFNEHTPRFWTSCPETPIDSIEWVDDFVWQPRWGLAQSDNSSPTLDFRCMQMEFFYFLPFVNNSREKNIALRRSRANVCHSILYHLIAIKSPMQSEETSITEYYIPPEVERIRCALAASRSNRQKLLERIKSFFGRLF